MRPRLNKKNVEAEIHKSFPKAKIVSYERFEKGLVSPTYKVIIGRPKKILVVKIYKPKFHKIIKKSEKVTKYLKKNGFPVPIVFSNTLLENQGILVMEYMRGYNAMIIYNKSSEKVKQNIMFNCGKMLKKIHSLDKIDEWRHETYSNDSKKKWSREKHNSESDKEWIRWTKLRVNKYLKFFKNNIDRKYYLFFRRELKSFFKILKSNNDFVPLHWDYHLANVLVDKKGDITALLDFDQAMKGHSLSDIGIAKYFLRFDSDDYKTFDYFLKGYGVDSDIQRKLIDGYFFLHLMAVTRSLYSKKKYAWIIKKHHKMFDEIMER